MEKLSKVLTALLIIVVAAFAYTLIFGLSFEFMASEGKESDSYLPVVSEENISAYKASCTELNLSKVSENPASLNGQKVKVKGQIQKKIEPVQFNKTRTYIELKVPGLQNPIIVSYASTIPFNPGDTIIAYGEYSYPIRTETSELANKDLIMIKATYIEKT
ncbi:MAG: hypothetical protein FJ150_00110 [Euryarchaeota archaeon]|nr:hypothetical protein [Euryarchaeota archaeon]